MLLCEKDVVSYDGMRGGGVHLMALVMKDLRCFRAWIGRRILYSKEGLN